LQLVSQRYELAKWVVPPVFWIASLWIPLQAVQPIAEDLAGEDTSVTFTFTFSVAISIALGAGMIALWLRSRGQRGELLRLRGRCAELERELEQRGGE
jgi:hypothetical protein